MRKILRDLSHLVVAYSSNEVRQCALTQCNKKIMSIFLPADEKQVRRRAAITVIMIN